jgi:D-arabinose 1-dehydrogenase-like Zn-dependent alcohol dehydrogenase
MGKMKAAEIPGPNKPFQIVEKEIPQPGPGKVRVKVQACGVCHSDSFTVTGAFPNIKYPRVPGHEIAGVIDALGDGVQGWKVGQRVGVGWFGGNCGYCESCRRGDFVTCATLQTPGVSYDGGYAEYVVTPASALALIPEELSSIEAAPLLCAGITTFNALRHSGAVGGDTVAILGIGGLGHLAVQFAKKMGFHTVAIARGKDKEALAKKLGADIYLNSEEQNVANELQKLGGAKVILATVTNGKAISSVVEGLATNGKLVVLGAAADPIQVSSIALLRARRSITGWPSGTSMDSQDTLDFSALSDIRSMNEIFPLEKAQEAYDHMMSGKARFRSVLQMPS